MALVAVQATEKSAFTKVEKRGKSKDKTLLEEAKRFWDDKDPRIY